MSAKIRLLPSNHTFHAEPGEPLLDAALRAGLSIRYSCSTGTCGECRARLIEGELGERLPQDYVFSQRERDEGHVLLCRTTARTDLTLEAVEARAAADIPLQHIRTEVCKLMRLTEDVMELQVRTPRSKTLWFLAGQHVRLGIDGIGPRHKSIASCPCNGRVLQFHVCRVPGDAFSDYVFDRLKVRDVLEVDGPFGDFVLDESSQRPLIFIAYETGFAPIKSLIEHAISLEMNQPMRLYWIARNAEEHYLENYCRSWHDALDDFSYVAIAADADTDRRAEQALARTAARIVDDQRDLSGYDVYVNGPEALFSGLMEKLIAHGLPAERLFIDRIQRI